MITFKKTTDDRYEEMLGVLPPAIMTRAGFMVGEPYDHDENGKPRFAAFIRCDGEHYEASEPMTIADFKKISEDRKIFESMVQS